MRMQSWLVGLALATAVCAQAGAAGDSLKLPDYRLWNHVKSMVILPGHPLHDAFGGMHHVYVNDIGLKASREGGAYPDGSILVFDLFESPESDKAHVAVGRKVTAIMVKDAKRFASTGGWGFEAFKPGSPTGIVKDAATECFGCHTAQKDSDYVFSRFHE